MTSAAVLILGMLITAPLLGAAFTVTSVTVEMETSEDVLVMNSDVDLTFTVTDKDSGDPITGTLDPPGKRGKARITDHANDRLHVHTMDDGTLNNGSGSEFAAMSQDL